MHSAAPRALRISLPDFPFPPRGVTPRPQQVRRDFRHALVFLDVGHHERPAVALRRRVARPGIGKEKGQSGP